MLNTPSTPSQQSYDGSSLLAIPRQKVSARFLTFLSFANGATWLAVIPLYQLLLPLQIADIDPQGKVGDLALITFIAGITALIAQPLTGTLSDRTTSRFGRRKPWMVAGMLLTVVALLCLSVAHSLLVLAVALAGFGFTCNILLSSLQATIPDRVPTQQRATASAIFGMAQPIGTLIGIIVISQLATITGSYLFIASLLFVMVLVLVVCVPEPPIAPASLPPFSWRKFFLGFFEPLAHRDFTLAWFARFWTIAAQTFLATYLLFYLQDRFILPASDVAQGVAIFQLLQTGSLVITSLLTGWLSDRLQRRKGFVLVAGVIMTLAFLLLAFLPSWPVVLVVAVLFGSGFGIFVAGDLALSTQVLPNANSQGRDMGLITAGSILPELFFPVVAWLAFTVLDGYSSLFLLCAVACMLGALCILPIKSVR